MKVIKKPKKQKLRNAEYYDLTEAFDRLYEESNSGKVFKNLMELIESEENIRLAYRNIKKNNAAYAEEQLEDTTSAQLREIYDAIDRIPGKFTEYDDTVTRMMVTRIGILSDKQVEITLFGAVTLKVDLC